MAERMSWNKLGVVFSAHGQAEWMTAYTWVPTADQMDDGLWKVYFASRNSMNMSQIGYFIIDLDHPDKLLEVSSEPVLRLGELGTFDDSAVLPSRIVTHGAKKFLYYIGWMQGKRVPYYASLGLAVSEDGGKIFQRFSRGPLLDRNDIDPYMTASADVMTEGGRWRMWYLSNTNWSIIDGAPRPRYHLKYAESQDGIHWRREGVVAIDFKSDAEYAISRPCVLKENGIYRMWYSYRGEGYRIGYAESSDGIRWSRMDDRAGITVSPSGWDSETVEYAEVVVHKGRKYMFYNGNDYGFTGIGLAVQSSEGSF